MLVGIAKMKKFTFPMEFNQTWESQWPRPHVPGGARLDLSVDEGMVDVEGWQRSVSQALGHGAAGDDFVKHRWWELIKGHVKDSKVDVGALIVCTDLMLQDVAQGMHAQLVWHLGKHIDCVLIEFVGADPAEPPPGPLRSSSQREEGWGAREVDKTCAVHIHRSRLASMGHQNFGIALDKVNARGQDMQNAFCVLPDNKACELVPQVVLWGAAGGDDPQPSVPLSSSSLLLLPPPSFPWRPPPPSILFFFHPPPPPVPTLALESFRAFDFGVYTSPCIPVWCIRCLVYTHPRVSQKLWCIGIPVSPRFGDVYTKAGGSHPSVHLPPVFTQVVSYADPASGSPNVGQVQDMTHRHEQFLKRAAASTSFRPRKRHRVSSLKVIKMLDNQVRGPLACSHGPCTLRTSTPLGVAWGAGLFGGVYGLRPAQWALEGEGQHVASWAVALQQAEPDHGQALVLVAALELGQRPGVRHVERHARLALPRAHEVQHHPVLRSEPWRESRLLAFSDRNGPEALHAARDDRHQPAPRP